jgi:hypothetical protein
MARPQCDTPLVHFLRAKDSEVQQIKTGSYISKLQRPASVLKKSLHNHPLERQVVVYAKSLEDGHGSILPTPFG